MKKSRRPGKVTPRTRAHPSRVRSKYRRLPVDLFLVEIEHLSARMKAEYVDFLMLVYACQVRITQGQLQGCWIEFQNPISNEAGLRVASWLYGVSFRRELN